LARLTAEAVTATAEVSTALPTAADEAPAQPRSSRRGRVRIIARGWPEGAISGASGQYDRDMRLLLNILWAILGGGLVSALEYLLAGLLCCLTVVGIPFGLQCFKLAALALFPFGKDFSSGRTTLSGTAGNILWLVFAGFWIFLTHLGLALGLAVTLIGIPFAYQHVKLGFLALWPFGVRVRELP
jgi:uncharacterized membrane protein YccF (DUF307 family)